MASAAVFACRFLLFPLFLHSLCPDGTHASPGVDRRVHGASLSLLLKDGEMQKFLFPGGHDTMHLIMNSSSLNTANETVDYWLLEVHTYLRPVQLSLESATVATNGTDLSLLAASNLGNGSEVVAVISRVTSNNWEEVMGVVMVRGYAKTDPIPGLAGGIDSPDPGLTMVRDVAKITLRFKAPRPAQLGENAATAGNWTYLYRLYQGWPDTYSVYKGQDTFLKKFIRFSTKEGIKRHGHLVRDSYVVDEDVEGTAFSVSLADYQGSMRWFALVAVATNGSSDVDQGETSELDDISNQVVIYAMSFVTTCDVMDLAPGNEDLSSPTLFCSVSLSPINQVSNVPNDQSAHIFKSPASFTQDAKRGHFLALISPLSTVSVGAPCPGGALANPGRPQVLRKWHIRHRQPVLRPDAVPDNLLLRSRQ